MPQCLSAMRSWNTHALITRAALSTVNGPRLDDSIPVVALEAFLSIAKDPLRDVLKWYCELLDRKVQGAAAKRGAISEIPKEILTAGDFLAALKLNVNCPLQYVRVLKPEEISPDEPHDPSRAGPPGGMYVETGQQEAIQAREILWTFSDEPDWGMDQDLFSVAQYGYGPCPFGPEHGPSSQAPFHMAFLHENPLVMAVRPGLGKSFMGERVQLFFALARTCHGERRRLLGMAICCLGHALSARHCTTVSCQTLSCGQASASHSFHLAPESEKICREERELPQEPPHSLRVHCAFSSQ